VLKTAGILYVFQGFYKQKLGQKIASLAEREFLEVPVVAYTAIFSLSAEAALRR